MFMQIYSEKKNLFLFLFYSSREGKTKWAVNNWLDVYYNPIFGAFQNLLFFLLPINLWAN